MPGLSGIETTEIIRSMFAKKEISFNGIIIILTAYNEMVTDDLYEEIGANYIC